MPTTTMTIRRLSPSKLALYIILSILLTVSLRAGDTIPCFMPFHQVFDHFPPWPEYAGDIEGTVLLDLKIDTTGHVADIHVIHSGGDVVDTAFAVALRRIRGIACRIDGRPVETWVRKALKIRGDHGGKGLDNYENAFANYTRSLENDTTNSAARFYGRGRVHYQFGDMEAARTDFETARNLGEMRPWFEEFQLDLVKPWLPSDTVAFDSLLRRAELYGWYGLFERARTLYLRLCRLQPDAIGPRRGLMLLYGDHRDYENAASIATALLQHGDFTASDLRYACWWLYSAGRYDRAVAAGEAALSLDPGMSFRSAVNVKYAIALLSQGQLGAARAAYKKTLELHRTDAIGDLKRHIRLGRPNSPFAREILMDVFHLDRDEIP